MWALVTGGTSPLGQVFVQHLKDKGYQVAVQYYTQEALAKQLGDLALFGDLTSEPGTFSFLEMLKKKDLPFSLFLHVVGPYHKGTVLETPWTTVEQLYWLHAFSPMRIAQFLAESLKETHGHILTLGIPGLHAPRVSKYAPLYFQVKQALYTWMKNAAVAFAPFSVRVNMLSPGYWEQSRIQPEKTTVVPTNTSVNTKELLAAFDYLLQSDHLSLTGQNIEVAGGVGL